MSFRSLGVGAVGAVLDLVGLEGWSCRLLEAWSCRLVYVWVGPVGDWATVSVKFCLTCLHQWVLAQ